MLTFLKFNQESLNLNKFEQFCEEFILDPWKEIFLELANHLTDLYGKTLEFYVYRNIGNWSVSLSAYPPGYHCTKGEPLPFIGIASQKNYFAIYHMGIYADPKLLEWFKEEYKNKVPFKLDMGKSCIRFKNPERIPMDLIKNLFDKMSPNRWIEIYESQIK